MHSIILLLRYIKHVFLFNLLGYFMALTPNGRVIQRLCNSKLGKRCFITATGPSLTPEDLELLKNEDTFGVNSIFLMYEKTSWRPKYYVCTDAPYFSKLIESYNIDPSILCQEDIFLNDDTRKLNPDFKDGSIHWIRFSPWNRIYDFKNYRLNTEIHRGMYAFGTVTNIVITIAMYMGYREIYLIGADCSNLNKHFINDVTDKDKDQQYVDNVVRIQLAGYEIMKKETEKRSVKVYNATRGGALEVFERVKLEDVLRT